MKPSESNSEKRAETNNFPFRIKQKAQSKDCAFSIFKFDLGLVINANVADIAATVAVIVLTNEPRASDLTASIPPVITVSRAAVLPVVAVSSMPTI